ncbi:hypothetical protein [Hydrogenobaculum acidophilum]
MKTVEERIDKLEELVERLTIEMISFKEEMRELVKISEESRQKDREEFNRKMEEYKRQSEESRKLDREEFNRRIEEIVKISEEDRQKDREEFNRKMEEYKRQSEEDRQKDREEFNRKMEEYKRQSEEDRQKDRREFNKLMGEIANKVGKLTEDIVRPAVRPVVEKYFSCELSAIFTNAERKTKDLNGEFDVIAVSDTCKTVYLIEVKSTMRTAYIDSFLEDTIPRFRALFKEYQDYKIIPIIAALEIKEDMLNYLSKKKIYAMAYREWDYMDILNFDRIKDV